MSLHKYSDFFVKARSDSKKVRILYKVTLLTQSQINKKPKVPKKVKNNKSIAKAKLKQAKVKPKLKPKKAKSKASPTPSQEKSSMSKLNKTQKKQVKVINKSIQVKSEAQAAKVLFQAIPNYPKVLQKRGIEGVSIVRLFIDPLHKASGFKIYKSSNNHRLDHEALVAAKRSKYQAQKNKNGANVGSFHKLLFRFTAP